MAFIDMGDQFIALMQGRTQRAATARGTSASSSTTRSRRGARLLEAGVAGRARPKPRLPRPVGQQRPGRAVRRGAVHEDRRACCAAWAWSSARPSRRWPSCARRAWPTPARIRALALLAQLVEHLHGKEGVDGSSPSEGFRFAPAQALFPLSRPATVGSCGVHRTSKAWTSAALMSA